MRVAAIDCGTNSIRLLVAESDDHSGVRELERQLELVRLGEGVDATGEFAEAALQRTFAATRRFAEIIADYRVAREHIRFVATSAARDARNRDEFYSGVREILGVEPEVISGSEEAALSFSGAVRGVGPVSDPVLVTDIGGGSTELVLGHRANATDPVHGDPPLNSASLNIGSVRLRERLMPSDPPTSAELAATRDYVDQQLDSSGVDLGAAKTWIAVAGTATSLAAIGLGLASYDRRRVHGSRFDRDAVVRIAREVASCTVAEVGERGPIPLRRAEVIAAGAVIMAEIASRVDAAELLVSESDILDGIAAQLLR